MKLKFLENLAFDRLLIPTAIVVLALLLLGALWVIATNRRRVDTFRRGWISRLSYTLFLGCIAALSATAFGSILKQGHMAHYALMAHMSAAGAFVFLMSIVAVCYLPRGSVTEGNWRAEHWSAWVLISSALVVAGSMLITMLPVFDTSAMNQLTLVHRYAGLILAIAAITHLGTLIAGRLGYR